MFTGLSGLQSQAAKLTVIGNNIANVNTTGYKANRMLFGTQFAQTLSEGTQPDTVTGGSNPIQIGLGVGIAGTQRDFSTGSISPTGDPAHLAIEGGGFFIVEARDQTFYTRSGAFETNARNELVTIAGERVQGYGVDDNYNIVEGPLGNLTIPIGTLSIAEATRNVQFAGNLDAGGLAATQGSVMELLGTAAAGLGLIAGATVPPTGTNVLETTSLLVEIEDPLLPASGTPLFSDGQQLEINGASKGTSVVSVATLAITAATTLQDFMTFLGAAMGIRTGGGANPDGRTPGVAVDAATGRLSVTGNTGEVNNLLLDSEHIRLVDAAGTFVRQPFVANAVQASNGESVQSTFTMFDSLGIELTANIAMVLENNSGSGTSWRYYIDSGDDSDLEIAVASGTLDFDANGQLTSAGLVNVQIDRATNGAVTPLAVSLDFGNAGSPVTAFADPQANSQLQAVFGDGFAFGSLTSFGIGQDGVITGGFSNGLQRTLGQVVLAGFTNPEGLLDRGGSLYSEGPNSGTAVATKAGLFGTGQIASGALELSNVDLGREFIDMILTSTGYTASSRVIRTADDLMQQLLTLIR
ncbi:flagellar hook-basal body complex protein [Roseiflexus sp. AH-315-K22]|nr:flagellar hook-basal body complex protein [Roseiflexus sp. AH-315-K22]